MEETFLKEMKEAHANAEAADVAVGKALVSSNWIDMADLVEKRDEMRAILAVKVGMYLRAKELAR